MTIDETIRLAAERAEMRQILQDNKCSYIGMLELPDRDALKKALRVPTNPQTNAWGKL